MKEKYKITENFKSSEENRKTGYLQAVSKLVSLEIRRLEHCENKKGEKHGGD